MIPMSQGTAASWFASLFGGAGQPVPTSTAPADSPQEWMLFSAILKDQWAGGLPVEAPSETEDTRDDASGETLLALVTPDPRNPIASLPGAPGTPANPLAGTDADARALADGGESVGTSGTSVASEAREGVDSPGTTVPGTFGTVGDSEPTWPDGLRTQEIAVAPAGSHPGEGPTPDRVPGAKIVDAPQPSGDSAGPTATVAESAIPMTASSFSMESLDGAQASTPEATQTRATTTMNASRQVTAAAAGASRPDAVREALDRVDVRSTGARKSAAARDLGVRLAVRPSTEPAAAPGADGVADATDTALSDAPRESMTETLVDEFLEDEAAHEAPGSTSTMRQAATSSSGDDAATGRTRGAAHSTEIAPPTPAHESAPVADRPTTPTADAMRADLGARVRQAIVETLEAESRHSLLTSVRDGWTAEVSVDSMSLGRVDVQVARAPGGLEVILVAAHEEAARALDAEMDDMAEELMRRDFEPAKITVRTQDGGHDTDRNSRNTQSSLQDRSRERDEDASAEHETEEGHGRGRQERELHEQEAGA